MATIDLAHYDLGELKGLLFDIGQEIKRRQKSDLAAARARIHALASDVGLSVDEVLAPASATAKGGARYRNPADSGQTWTGRGRQPKWLVDALAGGKSLGDFEI